MKVVLDPLVHAVRGSTASVAVLAVLTNLMSNRTALLSRQLHRLKVGGVFRFMHRLAWRLDTPLLKSSSGASVLASALGILCVRPHSRNAIVSLLSTNAASLFFLDVVAKHPQLAPIRHLDFAVFLALSGWLMMASLFHPESYESNHLALITKYSRIRPTAAKFLQDAYRNGQNPNSCQARHPGVTCTDYMRTRFALHVVSMGLKLYVPVHFMSWLLAFRHRSVRQKPPHELLRNLVVKTVRSAMYYCGYILIGWSIPCYTQWFGDINQATRRIQYLIGGSLPAASVLFESPSRRRVICVILCSYSFISVGGVLSDRFRWLKSGSGPIRTILDVLAVTVAVHYTISDLVGGSRLLQRLLYGQEGWNAHEKERRRRRASSSHH
ncbi:TPA: hypothetical protein N0F65_008828 [Lagenidium giganteum]|uniref:Transmembrane protein 135 N-terminal domain-containing protein n=1 Tax=Lagenidium giganteum TaxID=4803 RepID=A0AAV2YUH3_9STRA|nr:TPA: hypothetical protein N0F65_008828 [Lagenidium giganteum]